MAHFGMAQDLREGRIGSQRIEPWSRAIVEKTK